MPSHEYADDVPLAKKIDEFYSLIEGIEIAMLTGRRGSAMRAAAAMAARTTHVLR